MTSSMFDTRRNGWRSGQAWALAALVLGCANADAVAQTFAPYDGTLGYQELAVGPDTYYLAFHGNRDTSGPWVKAAWGARATQLCAAKGAGGYVTLRYIDEPVLPADAALAAAEMPQAWLQPVAGNYIYIPMIIPSGPRDASLDAPGKAGALRCLVAGVLPNDAGRVVRNEDSLAAARAAGVPVR